MKRFDATEIALEGFLPSMPGFYGCTLLRVDRKQDKMLDKYYSIIERQDSLLEGWTCRFIGQYCVALDKQDEFIASLEVTVGSHHKMGTSRRESTSMSDKIQKMMLILEPRLKRFEDHARLKARELAWRIELLW